MRPLADERGLTLIELLVSMVLTTIVFGVAMTIFVSLNDNHARVDEHNEAEQHVRQATDRVVRDLRNLASPTILTNVKESRPKAVELAGPYDLVFRSVNDVKPGGSLNDANVRRARVCLDATNPANGAIWMQFQTWDVATAPARPGDTACPGAGWQTQTLVATNVTNRIAGRDRPVFFYDNADVEKITRIDTELFVDPTPTRSPIETRLASGVVLRNQNQFPTAEFTITTLSSTSTTRNLRLDGSSSTDPEGQALSYCWYIDPPTPLPDCKAQNPSLTANPPSFVAEGIVVEASKVTAGTHTFALRVEDPAGLRAEKLVKGTF